MTDKQIIINGVDVSGCEFYNKDDRTCREVNGKYDTDICDFDKCENSICYYKQLKRQERRCKMWEDIAVDNGELVLKYQHQLDKLKAILTEIKEIIYFNKTNRLSGGACISIEQILQKISECEGNNVRS